VGAREDARQDRESTVPRLRRLTRPSRERGMRLGIVISERPRRLDLARSIEDAGHRVVLSDGDVRAVIGLLAAREVEVLVIDPRPWGIEIVAELRRTAPAVRPLVLAEASDYDSVTAAIQSGADGYISSAASRRELLHLLAEASRGVAPFSADVSGHVLRSMRRGVARERPQLPALTAREHQIVDLLAKGHGYASIASCLGIGLGTVQTHVKNLYRKLEVSSKAEAVAVVMRAGELPR